MSITLKLPLSFAVITRGKFSFEAVGETDEDCLNNLTALLPGIKEELFYPVREGSSALRGNLRPNVSIMLNGADGRSLKRKVQEGDVLEIKFGAN
ncbi:MAG: hypothetical protein K0B01_10520 [Syntrophobacterales bacterium]|nr:hypothetical protein [Syntrophobacterales bacterium]